MPSRAFISANDYLLFDAVGTLIYPNPSVAEVYANAAAKFGSQRSREQIESEFNAAYESAFFDESQSEVNHVDTRRRWRMVVTNLIPDANDPLALFDSLWSHFGEPANWSLYDDVKPCVKLLNSVGIPFAIASNFDNRITSVLAGFECLQSAQHIFWSTQIGAAKPAPYFYRYISGQLNRPTATLTMIGDSLANDFHAARAAGLQAINLCRSGGSKLMHVTSLSQLHT